MYDINESSESTFVPFTPGIKENCALSEVKYEPADKEGKKGKVLRFVFKGPAGEIHTETIFPLDKDQIIKQAAAWNQNAADLMKNQERDLTGKVLHIMSVYLPKDQCFFSAANWEDFCGKVITKLGNSFQNVPVRLKLVLNNKDYLMLPRRAVAPFIQKMSESNKLAINPKYDKVVYTPKAAVIADPFNPVNQLPFGENTTGAAPSAEEPPFSF